MNFARFNHVLVPQTAEERMAWLNSGKHSWMRGSFRLYLSLTPLGRGLLLFWLFAGALGLNVGETVVYILWAIISGLMGASILARRWYQPGHVSVLVTGPQRVQVGACVSLDVAIHNFGDSVGNIRIQMPFLTWDGKVESHEETIAELPGSGTITARTIVRFRARGAHSLMPFMVMRELPLGIAAGQAVSSNIVRVMVVPAFPPVQHLQLPARQKCHPGGVPMSSQTGEAQELAGVREYRQGDKVRDIHARTWARTGAPYVRRYQQEFFTRVGLVLDVYWKGVPEPAFEGAISLAAGVLSILYRQDSLVDVLCTGNQFHDLTIGRSIGFFEQGLDLLATVSSGELLSLESLEPQLLRHLDRMSTLLIVTAQPNEGVQRLLTWAQNRSLPVRVLTVSKGENVRTEGQITAVPLSAIVQGEQLSL